MASRIRFEIPPKPRLPSHEVGQLERSGKQLSMTMTPSNNPRSMVRNESKNNERIRRLYSSKRWHERVLQFEQESLDRGVGRKNNDRKPKTDDLRGRGRTKMAAAGGRGEVARGTHDKVPPLSG